MNRRNTIQRELVLQAAHKLNHPTADEIYSEVAQAHPAISRGTVYRNLGLLVSQGTLRKVPLPEADHFDITLDSHYHIVCTNCGKVVDADLPYQGDLAKRVTDSHGFLIEEEHDIIFRGVCPDCRKGNGGEHSICM